LRGGKLQQRMRKIRVTGLMHNLPDCIVVDVTTVDVMTPIRIEDIKYEHLTFMDSKRNIVVDLKSSRTMADDENADEEANS
jgi:large subunit ribosomal protein L25